MTSGQFLIQSRLSPKALRLYEQRKLLNPAHIDARTGYRYYGPAELDRARRVTLLRAIGMPLADIADVLSVSGPPAVGKVESYWRDAETKHAARRPLVSHLLELLGDQGLPMAAYEVHHRDVPTQKVIFVQRHVTADRLPRVLPETTQLLFDHLTAAGGTLSGPVFVAYHGLVTEDSNGPVEVCVPTRDPVQPDGLVGVRIERAHRQAYMSLTKAQATYPTILRAYDAIGHWLREHDQVLSASAREVYQPNWADAADDEYCVDVAFPYEPAAPL
ncbi:MerR family transcriptional regulator [Micromonospora sp. DR5-3]|uniref:MerR family transcriptional regulator n=1 Tax=unclassified Micromonospora TaxID=2617518 RepID=UPI001651BD21|nr:MULTISPECIES: MerR family transcriptional regulator [unclassified Micromonospora]MCW3820334.1 MerR family transcriptional regulator [Micromonospora sp. DR5-3]